MENAARGGAGMEVRTIRFLTYLGLIFLVFMKPTSCVQKEVPSIQKPAQKSEEEVPIKRKLSVSHVVDKVEEESKEDEFSYKILSEAVIDDPNLILAISNILVSGPLSKPSITKLLHEQYYSLLRRRRLKEKEFPSQIELYAFDSLGLANGVWVGMLEKKPHQRVPIIHINHDHLSFLQENEQQRKELQEFAKDKWYQVATVHYHHSTHTAEIIVDLSDIPSNEVVPHICNAHGGILIEALYREFSHLDNVVIKAFGDGLDIYGHKRRIQLYYVKADKPTVQKVNFNTLGYESAVKTIFKPSYHPQVKS